LHYTRARLNVIFCNALPSDKTPPPPPLPTVVRRPRHDAAAAITEKLTAATAALTERARTRTQTHSDVDVSRCRRQAEDASEDDVEITLHHPHLYVAARFGGFCRDVDRLILLFNLYAIICEQSCRPAPNRPMPIRGQRFLE